MEEFETSEEPEPTKQPSATSIQKLKLLVDRLWAQQQEITKANQRVSAMESVKKDLKFQIKCILKEENLSRFDGADCSVSFKDKPATTFPKDPVNRKLFMDYIFENNLENMLSIHHKTLNPWFGKEYDLAKEAGVELQIPGLEISSLFNDISVRKK